MLLSKSFILGQTYTFAILHALMFLACVIILIVRSYQGDKNYWTIVELILYSVHINVLRIALDISTLCRLRLICIESFIFTSYEIAQLVYRLLVDEDNMAWVTFAVLVLLVYPTVLYAYALYHYDEAEFFLPSFY